MSLENVTRPIPASESAELLSISARAWRLGKENQSLVDFVRFAEEEREKLIGGEAGSLSAYVSKPQ
jgi:hypothetical protein